MEPPFRIKEYFGFTRAFNLRICHASLARFDRSSNINFRILSCDREQGFKMRWARKRFANTGFVRFIFLRRFAFI